MPWVPEYWLNDETITSDTHIILEVMEGQREFWLNLLKQEVSDICQYYVGIWMEDGYVNEAGESFAQDELLAEYMTKPEAEPEPEPEPEPVLNC